MSSTGSASTPSPATTDRRTTASSSSCRPATTARWSSGSSAINSGPRWERTAASRARRDPVSGNLTVPTASRRPGRPVGPGVGSPRCRPGRWRSAPPPGPRRPRPRARPRPSDGVGGGVEGEAQLIVEPSGFVGQLRCPGRHALTTHSARSITRDKRHARRARPRRGRHRRRRRRTGDDPRRQHHRPLGLVDRIAAGSGPGSAGDARAGGVARWHPRRRGHRDPVHRTKATTTGPDGPARAGDRVGRVAPSLAGR